MTLPLITFDDRAGGVRLDLNQLIVSRLLIQANSGGGKSHAVRYLLEQTFGKVQQIVIDPEGEFATLREKYPYLLVGIGGDVPADIRGAKLLPRKLLELGLSAIIDLSEFGLPQQRSYVQNFTDALNHLPRELWKDCLVIYDEGHRWAPEVGRSSGKEVQPLTEAIATLQSAGRKRGFCGIIATQRLSKLNKDVAAECLNKLIGRTSNEDIKRAGDELGLSKLQGKELRSLEPGTFWAYGPAISIDPVMVRTGGITTHPPKRGAARAPAPAAPGAIKKVLAELADLPHEAVEEARTVQDLQRRNAEQAGRIRQLEKGGLQRGHNVATPVVDQAAIDRAVKAATIPLRRALEAAVKFIINISTQNFDVAGVDKAELERAVSAAVTKAAGMVEQRLAARQRTIEQLRANASRLVDALKSVLGDDAPVEISVGVTKNEAFTVRTPALLREPREPRPPREPRQEGDLGKGEKTMLVAIAQYPDGAERDQLTVLTGYKKSSRDTYIQRLSAAGLVEVRSSGIRATDAGVDALGSDFTPLPTGEQLQKYWLKRLPEGERKILQILVDNHGDIVGRDYLSEETGYKKSSRDTYLQRLGARRLIDVSKDGVRASATLFDGALV